jgi:hypothetical protein
MSARSRRLEAVGVVALLLAAVLLTAACGGDEEGDAGSAESAAASSEPAASGAAAESLAVVGTTFFFDDETLPTPEALKKFEAECRGETAPECKQLQWQLEHALYHDMRELARLGSLDDELLRVGAAAESPQLAAFSLERIGARGLEPGEAALVVAAFDAPYPRVREAAHALVPQLEDPKWARMLARDTDLPSHGVRGLIAGVAPDARRLGAPLYPDSTHWHFASSPARGDFFTTADDPDDVVEFYTEGGNDVFTGEQLTARVKEAKAAATNPLLLMQKMNEAMEAGEDPQAVMRTLGAGAAGADFDWTSGIDGTPGMALPRYVVLAEDELFGQPVPARVVAIFSDEAMAATGLIFRNKPVTKAPPDLTDPAVMEAYMRAQQTLASPDAAID